MAKLIINLDYRDDVAHHADVLIGKYESRVSDYDGIASGVDGVKTSRTNLASCSYYLRCKNQKLDDKAGRVRNLRDKIDAAVEHAEAADRRVADHVRDSSASFYQAVGIKTGWDEFCDRVVKGFKKIGNWIAETYEKNKYWINAVLDTVFAIAAVVLAVVAIAALMPFSIVALLAAAAATWGAISAISDATASIAAYDAWRKGDRLEAERWADRDLLAEGFMDLGGWVGSQFGQEDAGRQAGSYLYCGCQVASFAYGGAKSLKSVGKALNLHRYNKSWKLTTVVKKNLGAVKKNWGSGLAQVGKGLVGWSDTTKEKRTTLRVLKSWFKLPTQRSAQTIKKVATYTTNVHAAYSTVTPLLEGANLFTMIKPVAGFKKAFIGNSRYAPWASLSGSVPAF
ncbi:MAG: hypothetical protein LBL86_02065 [Coriobacteriales bacterium]|jgi:hypothetical protein|nr:hypothetical protein [Coriobacteriales bacterium]